MYCYKLTDSADFEMAYKKYIKKALLKGSLILVCVINIFMFLLSILVLESLELRMEILSSIITLTLLLEFFIFLISYRNECKKLLTTVPNDEVNISFDEEGVYFESHDISRHVKWKAVSNAIVDKDSLRLHYKLIGLPGNFFYLKFFDVEAEELIKDIEKYIKVRRIK